MKTLWKKAFTLAIAGVVVQLLIACGSQPQGCDGECHKTKAHKRFQSVDPEQAVLLEKGEYKANCGLCGMHLPTFYKTNHAITFSDGTSRQFCSIHCLVELMEYQLSREEKAQIVKIQAVDAKSIELIDAKAAYYVIGSKKPGTMSMVSKYAFKEKADAEAFAKEFGGEVTDFDHAYAKAKEDFASRKMMHYH